MITSDVYKKIIHNSGIWSSNTPMLTGTIRQMKQIDTRWDLHISPTQQTNKEI